MAWSRLELGLACAVIGAWAVSCAIGGGSSSGDGEEEGEGAGPTTTTAAGGTGTSTGTSTSAGGAGGSGTTSSGTGGSSSSSSGTGGMCSELPCKVTLPQCGCPSGQQCTIGANNERECIADGNVKWGELCSGPVCEAGTMCLGDATFASCKKFCDTDAECKAPGGLCILQVDDGKGGTLKEKWCSDNCDPVTATGCPGNKGKCEIGQDEGPPVRFFTTCLTAGKKTQGQACSTITDCAVGYTCVNVNNQNTCAKWCKVSSPNCLGGTSCASFGTPLMIGSTEYGACI